MSKCMLGLLLFLFPLIHATTITSASLINSNGTSFLELKITPTTNFEQILITPEQIQILSGGQFALSENLILELNTSNTTLSYEIDRTSVETIYSPSFNLWCGASFSDCNKCNGMPPGTFKWCNGQYPKTSYSCDNWCYSYSPNAAYEKAQVGQFQKAKAAVEIRILKTNQTNFTVSDSNLEQSNEYGLAKLTIPPITPPSQSGPLFHPLNSNKWQSISPTSYQNYKNSLSQYFAQYTLSLDAAYTVHNSLAGAYSSLLSTANGEYYGTFDIQSQSALYPKLTLDLAASYAGVTAARGKPKVTALNSDAQFNNGLAYYLLSFQNIGAATDSFAANLSCNDSLLYSSPAIQLDPVQPANMELYVSSMPEPALCAATVFVPDQQSLADSISQTLQPFKFDCPQDKQCCSNSPQYNDKLCAPQEKFSQQDQWGNGYYYTQYYNCENYVCIENYTNVTRVVSGLAPTPTPTTPTPTLPSSYSSPYSPPPTTQPPRVSPTPNSTLSPSPTPTLPPAPHSPILTSIPITEELVEIQIPASIEEGYHSIQVFTDSKPAKGTLRLISPSYKSHSILLESGAAEALFNEPGEWKVAFKDEAKYVTVSPIISNVKKETAEQPASAATGFIALNFSKLPLLETGVFLAFFVFCFAGYKSYSERIRFRKSFENNIVRLEIINTKTDLRNLEITDIVPEGNVLSTISNPPSEVTEIIFGKHIKWKKNELRKGEKMLISYSIFANNTSEVLRAAELEAEIEGNKRIRVVSNSIKP